jgi:acyl-CoA thioesterase-2
MLTALTLTPLTPAAGSHQGEDLFSAPSLWTPQRRVFGGQVAAQAILAAMRTVDADRFIHSMHGYFLRPGDDEQDITFSVDRIHDGRSFSTRRTQAYQNGTPILSMIASFQDVDPGLEHQIEMPTDIPPPEDLPSARDLLGPIDHPAAQYWANSRPFDLRHADAPVYLTPDPQPSARQAVWFRSISPMPDDENVHRAALAYASDYTVLEPILRRHGATWATPGLKMASLDHAMWWHRFARVDDWLLYVQDSPSATGGRGLAQGHIFTRDGMLVATVAQEGMVRIP